MNRKTRFAAAAATTLAAAVIASPAAGGAAVDIATIEPGGAPG